MNKQNFFVLFVLICLTCFSVQASHVRKYSFILESVYFYPKCCSGFDEASQDLLRTVNFGEDFLDFQEEVEGKSKLSCFAEIQKKLLKHQYCKLLQEENRVKIKTIKKTLKRLKKEKRLAVLDLKKRKKEYVDSEPFDWKICDVKKKYQEDKKRLMESLRELRCHPYSFECSFWCEALNFFKEPEKHWSIVSIFQRTDAFSFLKMKNEQTCFE